MAKTWRDIFKPEIEEWIMEGRADEKRINLFKYVQDGVMPIDYVAQQANLSTDDFVKSMRKAGFNVPQETLV